MYLTRFLTESYELTGFEFSYLSERDAKIGHCRQAGGPIWRKHTLFHPSSEARAFEKRVSIGLIGSIAALFAVLMSKF